MVHSYAVGTMFGAAERKRSIVLYITPKFENKNDNLYIPTLFGAISSDILDLQSVT